MEAKAELTKTIVLSHDDLSAETEVSADASSYGLGAVLLQKHGSEWKPVIYASRSLPTVEKTMPKLKGKLCL